VAVGVAVLVARPFAQAATGTRTALFVASYLTIGLASIAVPLERERPRLAPGLALLCGFGAVVVAANVSASPVPIPWSAAALPLSLLAAVAEEALFRRLAYARLEPFGAAVAVVGSAVLFGLVHVPAYGLSALPVDVGVGLLFGWQRWASGTWTVPAATHAVANALVVLR
jgi:membrane protease YdiL (CAAX protease family)